MNAGHFKPHNYIFCQFQFRCNGLFCSRPDCLPLIVHRHCIDPIYICLVVLSQSTYSHHLSTSPFSSHHLSIYLSSISPSLHFSISQYLHLNISISISPSQYLNLNLNLNLSISISIYPYLFFHLSILPFLHLYLFPFLHLYIFHLFISPLYLSSPPFPLSCSGQLLN